MAAEKDTLFGRLAVERGYLTRKQVAEAREAQRMAREQMGMDMSISQVLLNKHFLTPDQAQDLDNAVAVQTGEARLVAGYEVLAKIGQGGMGAVYKARKLDTDEIVALKILTPSLATPEYVERFRRESEVVRKLDHEHIVGWVEFGRDERRGFHFCALEFVEGEDLEDSVHRGGALREDEAISITYQITRALQHAHFNGLIHRDVKPANIMVRPDGKAKLLDLGLARSADKEATRYTESGLFVGSTYYASPELARAEREIDIRSDIYSLGATLYYMATGRPPFEGATALAVLQQHAYEKLPWPADINPEVSKGLCLVITKMMAKDPADRYQTPIDLLRELDRLKEGRAPEVGEKVKTASTIAPMGAVVRRRRRSARTDRRRSTRYPGRAAPEAGRPVWPSIALAAAAPVALAIVLVFVMLGRKKRPGEGAGKGPPPVRATGGSERGHDTGTARPASSARRDTTPEVPGTGAGRIVSPEARRTRKVPPPARTTAAALREADDFERAHPEDIAGAIARYEAVTKQFPGTIEAGKAQMYLARLRSMAEAKARQRAEGEKDERAAAAGMPPRTRGLVGHWTFDEGQGNVARDSSARGNHGRIIGTPRWAAGKIGGALDFDGYDGSQDYVEIPNSPSLEDVQDGDYTLSAWVCPDTVPPNTSPGTRAYSILQKPGYNNGLCYYYTQRFRMEHWLEGNTAVMVESGNQFAPGTFHHVVVVVSRTNGTVELYVDGNLEGTGAFTAGTAAREYGTAPWRIGCTYPGQVNHYSMDGKIDDARIYDRDLSEPEIQALADTESIGIGELEMSGTFGGSLTLGGGMTLADWLKADAGVTVSEGRALRWADRSGSGNHAAQGEPLRRPLYVKSRLSGRPVVRFDGVDDYMTFTLPVNGLTGMTVFLLSACARDVDCGQYADDHCAIWWGETAAWGGIAVTVLQKEVGGRFGTRQENNVMMRTRPTRLGATDFTTTVSMHDGASGTDYVYVDGIQVLKQTGKSAALAGCKSTPRLGGDDWAKPTHFPGDIAEVLVYDRALSAAERQGVERHLKAK